jgi:PIN domain nuclease of toxin-antitoxin system
VRVLLDTHVVLWASLEPDRLSEHARTVLLDPSTEVRVSHATLWELAIKASLGKLRLPTALDAFFAQTCEALGALELPIRPAHLLEVERLPLHHRDPFDRLLVAAARLENLSLMTADTRLSSYAVPIVWLGAGDPST